MAFKAGSVYGEAILDDSKWKSGIKGVESSNQSMFKSFVGAQLAVDAFKKVLSATINETKKAISNAIAYTETQNKFKVVFGDGTRVLKEAADAQKNLTQNYGLSKKAALEMLSSTGDLLTGLGFTKKEAIGLSEQVQTLAVDLSSFQNVDMKFAAEGLTKALLGETEQAKSLGIVIRQNTKEFNEQVKALVETKGMTEIQAKSQLILQQAYEQSRNAVGDYARTADSLANMQKQLEMQQENISTQMGTILLPVVNQVTKGFLDGAKSLNEFLSSEKNIEKIQNTIANVAAGFEVFFNLLKGIGTDLFNEIKNAINDITDSFSELFGDLKGNISVFDILGGAVKIITINLATAIKVIKAQIQVSIDWINVLKNVGQALVAVAQALVNPTKWKEAKEQLSEVKDSFKLLATNAIDNVDDIVRGVVKGFKSLPDAAKDNSAKYNKIWNDALKKYEYQAQETTDAVLEMEDEKTEGSIEKSKAWLDKQKEVLEDWKEAQGQTIQEIVEGLKQQRDEFVKYGVEEVEANRWVNREINKLWASNLADIASEMSNFFTTDLSNSVASGLGSVGKSLTDGFSKIMTKVSQFGKDTKANVLNTVSSALSAVAGLYSAITDIISSKAEQDLEIMKAEHEEEEEEIAEYNELQLENEQLQYEMEQEQLDLAYEQGLISEAEYNIQQELLDKKHTDAQNKIKVDGEAYLAAIKQQNRDKEDAKARKMFEANKATQIAMIWIQTAIGSVAAFAMGISQLGPIAGAIIGGVMTGLLIGMAAAQTAVISQQQYVPARAEGGMASGTTRVNELGGEIITLPDGSQVIPNDISQQIAASTGGNKNININVSMRGAVISDNMSLQKVSNYVSRDIARQLRYV
jgi:hypothetical protein